MIQLAHQVPHFGNGIEHRSYAAVLLFLGTAMFRLQPSEELEFFFCFGGLIQTGQQTSKQKMKSVILRIELHEFLQSFPRPVQLAVANLEPRIIFIGRNVARIVGECASDQRRGILGVACFEGITPELSLCFGVFRIETKDFG